MKISGNRFIVPFSENIQSVIKYIVNLLKSLYFPARNIFLINFTIDKKATVKQLSYENFICFLSNFPSGSQEELLIKKIRLIKTSLE